MSEWQVKPLGELADFVMGQSPQSAFVHETERGLPFLQGCAEFGPRHPSPVLFVDPPQRIAPAGSVLISVRAPVGTLNFANRDCGIGRGLAAVIGRRRSSRFLAYAIESSIPWLHARSQGSTFLAIGSADLRSLPIPIHATAATDEFAAEQLNCVDTQITHTEALIAKQEQVRAGLMQDLFTRGVDETGRLRPPREEAPELYHKTPSGWLPKGWECRLFRSLLTEGPKNGHSPKEADEWTGTQTLGLGCLTKSGYAPVHKKNVAVSASVLSQFGLQLSDFLMSRSNTPELVGLCGRYRPGDAPCIYPDLMMRLRFNADLIDNRSAEAILLSPRMRLSITAAAVGTSGSMVKLNSQSVGQLLLPLPSELRSRCESLIYSHVRHRRSLH